MAEQMTGEERRRFLSEGTRTAKLATVRADGRPHVVPVWFVLDGDDIVFQTGKDTVKGRNILRDGRVSVCVDDEQPPYAFVRVEGHATATDNPPEALAWATRIAARYMGPDLAEAYGRRNAVPGELLVRITPSTITATRGVAD
jgi:PPOX class probable F420-dependent enzyme